MTLSPATSLTIIKLILKNHFFGKKKTKQKQTNDNF